MNCGRVLVDLMRMFSGVNWFIKLSGLAIRGSQKTLRARLSKPLFNEWCFPVSTVSTVRAQRIVKDCSFPWPCELLRNAMINKWKFTWIPKHLHKMLVFLSRKWVKLKCSSKIHRATFAERLGVLPNYHSSFCCFPSRDVKNHLLCPLILSYSSALMFLSW